MLGDLLFGATILIGIAGVALLADLARVWMVNSGSLTYPDRQQLVVGLATVAFAALFFLGWGLDGGGSVDPLRADPQPVRAQFDDASLTRLAVGARLPDLRSRERPRQPVAEQPRATAPEPAQPPPAAEDVPVTPPPQDVEPAAEPAPAPVPEPAPTPAPAPAPEPAPPVGFDDSG